MSLLWVVLIGLVVCAVVAARLFAVAARWGRELQELKECGVETTGTVVRKVTFNTKGGRSRYIRYEYLDQFGRRHGRKTIAMGDAWERHVEGGPIAIVYSSKNPRVSAAKYMFDTMVEAMRNTKVTRSSSV